MGISTKRGTGVSGDVTRTTAGVYTVADDAVDGTDIEIGGASEAAGDTYYSDGTDVVRLAKGTRGDSLKMNAGNTAPAWVGSGNDTKYSKNVYIQGSHICPTSSIAAGSAATGADTTTTYTNLGWGLPPMVIYNTGTNNGRIQPVPIVDANCCDGFYLPSTNTDNVGGTITFGGALPDLLATTGAPTCFTVGTDAAFYMKVSMGIPDISDYDVLGIGFVEPAAAYVAAIDTTAELQQAYDEKAMFCLADNAGDVDINTSLAGVDVNTDLTVTDWVDDAVKQMGIYVSAAGAVTYRWWDAGVEDTSTGAAAFTFADTTVVTPCIIFAKGAAAADTPPIIEYIEWGYQ